MECAYCGSNLTTTSEPCPGCGRKVILLDSMTKWTEVHSRAFAVAEAKYPGVKGILALNTEKQDLGFRAYCWWQSVDGDHEIKFLCEDVTDPDALVNAAKRGDRSAVKALLGTFYFEALGTETSLGGLAFCTKSSPRLKRA